MNRSIRIAAVLGTVAAGAVCGVMAASADHAPMPSDLVNATVFAEEYETLVKCDVIEGRATTGLFDPSTDATRGETGGMIARLAENIECVVEGLTGEPIAGQKGDTGATGPAGPGYETYFIDPVVETVTGKFTIEGRCNPGDEAVSSGYGVDGSASFDLDSHTWTVDRNGRVMTGDASRSTDTITFDVLCRKG